MRVNCKGLNRVTKRLADGTSKTFEKAGRLYRASRNDRVWTAADEVAFLKAAPAHLHLPLFLALWTGQRQGDLLRLPWSAYDGAHHPLKQSKSGRRLVIPVGAPLKIALDSTTKQSTIIRRAEDDTAGS